MRVFICYDCERTLPVHDAVNEVIDGLALCRACNRALIDALMLEHCPDEMTDKQLEEWGNAQVIAPNPDDPTGIKSWVEGNRQSTTSSDVTISRECIQYAILELNHNQDKAQGYAGPSEIRTREKHIQELKAALEKPHE